MNQFSDFKIAVSHKTFTGDKIQIKKLLNRRITVLAFKIDNSKHFKNECLTIQIEVNGNKHVCFSGSTKLIEQIKQVPDVGFPFETIIESDNEMYLFT